MTTRSERPLRGLAVLVATASCAALAVPAHAASPAERQYVAMEHNESPEGGAA
jgi:hypothetical protein